MIENVSVIGGGTMGVGIALVFAMHDYDVRLYDAFGEMLQQAPTHIRKELEFLADESFISDEKVKKTMDRISFYSDLKAAVGNADYVIEAIPERMDLKKRLFEKLDRLCPDHTVFATNTSSLKISDIISDLPRKRQERCMVCHWYNPAYLIPLVELSCFEGMDIDVFWDVYDLYVKSGKKPIRVCKDVPGMVANRLSHSLAREVFHLIQDGVAEEEDVEKALKYGVCFRYATTGILECADMGGLDIWCATEDNIFPTLDASEKAFDMMRSHVKKGELGLKTGKGFFDYQGRNREEVENIFYKKLIVQLKASSRY